MGEKEKKRENVFPRFGDFLFSLVSEFGGEGDRRVCLPNLERQGCVYGCQEDVKYTPCLRI